MDLSNSTVLAILQTQINTTIPQTDIIRDRQTDTYWFLLPRTPWLALVCEKQTEGKIDGWIDGQIAKQTIRF